MSAEQPSAGPQDCLTCGKATDIKVGNRPTCYACLSKTMDEIRRHQCDGPSAGAVRAAEIIRALLAWREVNPDTEERTNAELAEVMAAIIDRETGAGELWAALRYITTFPDAIKAKQEANAALAKYACYDRVSPGTAR